MPPSSSPSSRRTLLGTAIGAAVTAVAATLGRPQAANAANVGDPLLLASVNSVAGMTRLTNTDPAYATFAAYTTNVSRYAALGTPTNGVYAEALGAGETAVRALSYDGTGVTGSSTNGTGVSATGSIGVHGSTSTGVGVRASSDAAGTALKVEGRTSFPVTSGVKSIPAGKTALTFSPGVDVTATSFVLLTPRANIGARSVWYTVDATANTVTIRLSTARTSSTPIAWLLLG